MAEIHYMVKEELHITHIESFFKRHCNQLYEFKREYHNFWESMYVLDGSLCATAGDRVYELSAGQCIFHQPRELHNFRVSDTNGANILVFSYIAEGNLCDFFREKVFTLNAEQQKALNQLVEFADAHADDNPSVYRRYFTAIRTVPFFPQRICFSIQQLMLSLVESNNISHIKQTEDSDNYTAAVRYMTERVTENLTIKEIAEGLHFSGSTLKRIIRKYTGTGVHKYFLQLKIKAAIELLEKGESVTSVARILNFSSQANFTNMFKRETGNSPSVYRKKSFK